jgi:hypothetical protein
MAALISGSRHVGRTRPGGWPRRGCQRDLCAGRAWPGHVPILRALARSPRTAVVVPATEGQTAVVTHGGGLLCARSTRTYLANPTVGITYPQRCFPRPIGRKDRKVIPPDDRLCAAVCRNGHVIKDDLIKSSPLASRSASAPPMWVEGSISIGSPPSPPTVPLYCGRCGSAVIQACSTCDASLLGAVRTGWGEYAGLDRPDSFCWQCGKAYPWATREERIGKLYDEIDHEDLDEATLLAVREGIAVLSAPVDEETDERRGQALERLKRLAPKMYEAALPAIQGLVTAGVKKKFDLE